MDNLSIIPRMSSAKCAHMFRSDAGVIGYADLTLVCLSDYNYISLAPIFACSPVVSCAGLRVGSVGKKESVESYTVDRKNHNYFLFCHENLWRCLWT